MKKNSRIENGAAVPEQHNSSSIRLFTVKDGRVEPHLLDGEDINMWKARVCAVLGTESYDLAIYALETLSRACKKPDETRLNAMIAQIREEHPRNTQEIILLTQMAATNQRFHEAIAMSVFDIEAKDALQKAKTISEYVRLYNHQVEALQKYRSTVRQ